MLLALRSPHANTESNGPQLALWDTSYLDDQQPLLCGTTPATCACFAPKNDFVVAAGNAIGVIVLWDLREHGDPNTRARRAVYTTDGLLDASSVPCDAHTSSITDLHPLSDVLASSHGSVSFQLASIDDRGNIAIWLISESTATLVPTLQHAISVSKGSSADHHHLGLRAGSLLCLSHLCNFAVGISGSARLTSTEEECSQHDIGRNCSLPGVSVGPYISAFAVLPEEPNEFLVSLSALILSSEMSVSI